jgi:hypothetical protein
MFTANPMVNKRAHTVFPDEACETPNLSAAAVKFLPKATPTLGRQERIPARIAMVNPALNVSECEQGEIPRRGGTVHRENVRN